MKANHSNYNYRLLIIFGSGSSVLKGFVPENKYDLIINADRKENLKKVSQKEIFINYDLENDDNNDLEIINFIKKKSPEKIDVIFSSYKSEGLSHNCEINHIAAGLRANIGKPLRFFSYLSNTFKEQYLNVVFISSMYAKIVPNISNYDSQDDINPLFYGASKAAVDQGLKWLSCQREKHRFNSVRLGPMPKDFVKKTQPKLMSNLIKNIPSKHFVHHKELYKTINFLLSEDCLSLRGESIVLDGGYSIW